MAQTKTELLEELSSQLNKEQLVEVLGSKLKKDDLARVLDDDQASKGELVRKLGSRTKDELTQTLGAHLTKDELQRVLDARASRRDDHGTGRAETDDDDEIDWSAELEWARPPRPTPAPVTFAGAAPFQPGHRVRVDLAGLPMLGVFAGKGASAAGTIVGVDARERMVRVYLDAVFDGEKEIVVPPERITPDS